MQVSLTHSLTHSRTHARTHSLTRSLARSLAHSLTQCVNAWTPCGGPVLGAGGEPNKTDIESVRPVRLAASPFRAQALNFVLYTRCMLIGCKNLRNHSIVASKLQSPAQCPPSDPIFGSDNTSPVCCPNGVLAAQSAWPHRLPM